MNNERAGSVTRSTKSRAFWTHILVLLYAVLFVGSAALADLDLQRANVLALEKTGHTALVRLGARLHTD